MTLTPNAEKLIAYLTDSGFKAYAVGGCVRDSLMKRSVNDIDLCTSAKPDEVEAILQKQKIRVVETGIKHGTVTAVIDGESYEITTFRTDGEYLDNRRPENVSFVSDIKYDLARRDFTINAIAFNPKTGYVDLYGGMQDIENKLIRAVGDPDKRFNEDALRIMRALRFSAVLGFDIEENTEKALFENKELLLNIAGERIYVELVKLLLGNNCEDVLLKYRDIIAVVIPELKSCFDYPQNSKWHIYDVYTHIVKSVAVSPKKDYMRLALLFHDIGKPECKTTDENGQDHFKGHPQISAQKAYAILKRLKVSNRILKNTVALIENHDYYITERPAVIKKWLRKLGEGLTLDYIDLKIADLATHNLVYAKPEIDNLYQIRALTEGIIKRKEPYKISDLKINGNALFEIGFKGSEIQNELEVLINRVSGNPDCNKEDKLIKAAIRDFEELNK